MQLRPAGPSGRVLFVSRQVAHTGTTFFFKYSPVCVRGGAGALLSCERTHVSQRQWQPLLRSHVALALTCLWPSGDGRPDQQHSRCFLAGSRPKG
jgi:hypothetical protein